MSVKTVLDKIGVGAKDVFNFLMSPRGQEVVRTGEAAAVVAAGAFGGPAAATLVGGYVSMLNNWAAEVIKVQALATAAGQASGSGPQKSAAVISSMMPEILSFAQQHGLPAPKADQLQSMNDAVVAFFNAWNLPAGPVVVAASTNTTVAQVEATVTQAKPLGQS